MITLPRRLSRRERGWLVDPASPAAEPFRTLRLALDLRRDTVIGNTILVTGPEPGVGKSVIAANYALVSSLGRSRVLLIDGDLRNPSLHTTFGIDRSPGLVEFFADPEARLDSFVRRYPLGALDVLPAGRAIPRSGDLAASHTMAQLLEDAAAEYDLVVIDSPPMLMAADAEGYASHEGVDVVIVVKKTTKKRLIRKTLRRLELIEANVAGLVVNRYGRQSAYTY